MTIPFKHIAAVLMATALITSAGISDAKTVKPVLHGQNWVAVTGKPLAATAGAKIFVKGGNAVDAACAMIAATSTMWDTLGWGGGPGSPVRGEGPRGSAAGPVLDRKSVV